jgi:hypothetical protein
LPRALRSASTLQQDVSGILDAARRGCLMATGVQVRAPNAMRRSQHRTREA